MSASTSRLRPHLEEFRNRNRNPAIGAGIVTRESLLDLEVIGERVRGGGDPALLGDRWHVGSCGKSMTAALYGRLVELGDAEWGAPLPTLFPDLAGSVDPGWSRISIDDVFVSQAGLPANLTKAEMLAAWKDATPLPEQRTEVAARSLARVPRRPGRFLYSNLGYIVIGAAIERITGVPYESALRTHVFEPLGIASGGFGAPPELWGHQGRMLALGPLGALDLGSGAPADPREPGSDNPAVMTPAGRMHLTLEDWAKFHRVFLTDGGGFLRPDTIERLLTPAAGTGQRQAFGWAPVRGKADASFGQQGSNLSWVATAIIDADRERTAMVVCNDGRPRLLRKTAQLALQLLSET
jgi:CubicO group peptidase (beta-lactamase class C family)